MMLSTLCKLSMRYDSFTLNDFPAKPMILKVNVQMKDK